ncbi:MAG: hemolysin family protein [Thermoanaerobaculia bacterium]|nr:hemolysin family protein [Thermoanaerobaculia bacterium]
MTALFVVIGLSLAISFACSILEAVLLSVTHSYVGVLQEKGHPAGSLLARMRESIDEPIAAILTLNTIAHTVGAAMGGALALEVFGSRWIALFSVVLTFVILVFSEILPKTIGATYWQGLAPFAAWVLRAMILLMKPVLVPLSLLNRLISPRRERQHTVSRAELEVLAAIGRREGTIDQEEWQVLTNVMNLDEVSVAQVMTPRTRIVAVPLEASLDEAERVMLEKGRLRLPVYQGSLDRIVGLLLARDLWRAARAGATELAAVMRKPTFIPDTKPVEDTLRLMRQQRIQMAIVLDEYGGTAGLVTLEDLIEEIVGEIEDEHEPDLPSFVEMPDGRVRILGSVPVDEVNERLALDLPEEEYDSIGGCVFGLLGRIPEVGDEVRFAGGALRVLEMVSRRVEKVEFEPSRPTDPPD